MPNTNRGQWYQRLAGKGLVLLIVVLIVQVIILFIATFKHTSLLDYIIIDSLLLLAYFLYCVIDLALYVNKSLSNTRSNLFSPESLEKLSQAERGDVQQIAASQIELLEPFYTAALAQAQRSFHSALIAAYAGSAFFVAAVVFLIITQSPSIALVNVISGTVVEVIAGVNFILYGRATEQFGVFHMRLDTTQRFLMANSICESIEGDLKHSTRADLVRAIAAIDPISLKEQHEPTRPRFQHLARRRATTDLSED